MRHPGNKELRTICIEGADYCCAAEVAKVFGISRQTLWRWRRHPKVPTGRRYRSHQVVFTAAEVEATRTYASRLEPTERHADPTELQMRKQDRDDSTITE